MLKKLRLRWLKWRKERLHPSKRGYVLHPEPSERTDGKMIRREVLTRRLEVRCESPEPDGSGDFCVQFRMPGVKCRDHWCLRSDERGRIYGHHWTRDFAWNYSKDLGVF